jgi:hypothetical protein
MKNHASPTLKQECSSGLEVRPSVVAVERSEDDTWLGTEWDENDRARGVLLEELAAGRAIVVAE